MKCDNRYGANPQRIVLGLVSLVGFLRIDGLPVFAAPTQFNVSPETIPFIKLIKPAEGAPGDELTLVIEGQNFSEGVYVSFSDPAVHALTTRRVSATVLEAKIQIGKKARPGAIALYVSNPASSATQGTFRIAGEPPPLPGTEELKATDVGQPEVAAVDPPRAVRGSQANIKIKGKNFATGAKVAFSNPGILVTGTNVTKSTELITHIQIAPDAPTGRANLFVVNPDDREAESAFEVAEGNPSTPAPPKSTSTPAADGAVSATQRFEVFNLGDGVNILQSPDKAKGTLTLARGKLKYQEGGKELFGVGTGDIQEVEVNIILGVNTGTFHIILKSRKTYNFIAASLRPTDSQTIVDSLRRTLH